MKILKWFLFVLCTILCIVSIAVVYLMYSNLSFIDYPYVISAVVNAALAIIAFRYKVN